MRRYWMFVRHSDGSVRRYPLVYNGLVLRSDVSLWNWFDNEIIHVARIV